MLKHTLLLLFLSTSIISNAQSPSTFTLVGQVGNTKKGKICLTYASSSLKEIRDTAQLKDGKFIFEGSFIPYQFSSLELIQEKVSKNSPKFDQLYFFLDKGHITVKSDYRIRDAKVTGSSIQNEYESFSSHFQEVNDKIRDYQIGLNNGKPGDKSAWKALTDEKLTYQKSFIKGYSSSYFCLQVMKEIVSDHFDTDTVAKYWDLIDESLRVSTSGTELQKMIEKANLTAIGKKAPDFTLKDKEGESIRLSSLRGNYILVDFWASWCYPCRQEMPHLRQAYEKHKTEGFNILGVSIDSPNKTKEWLKAINDDGMEWLNVIDVEGEQSVSELYGIKFIPRNFLIDPEGTIIAKNLRGNDVLRVIDKFMTRHTNIQ